MRKYSNKFQQAERFFRKDSKIFLLYVYHLFTPTKPTQVKPYTNKQLCAAIKDGKSFIRFGDGEAAIMAGLNIGFQNHSKALADSLQRIVTSYDSKQNYILGIPIDKVAVEEAHFSSRKKVKIWRLFRIYFRQRFPRTAQYASAFTFYQVSFFKDNLSTHFKHHHVLCVSNRTVLNKKLTSYLETIFDTISYIEVPEKNAFAEAATIKEAIIDTITKHQDKTPLVICAAGPTSKVIAYELSQIGVQCLDIGHGLVAIAAEQDRNYSN